MGWATQLQGTQESRGATAAAAAGKCNREQGARQQGRGRRRGSRQDEAVAHLGLVQEGLVGLVDGAGLDLARAGGASAGCGRAEGTL